MSIGTVRATGGSSTSTSNGCDWQLQAAQMKTLLWRLMTASMTCRCAGRRHRGKPPQESQGLIEAGRLCSRPGYRSGRRVWRRRQMQSRAKNQHGKRTEPSCTAVNHQSSGRQVCGGCRLTIFLKPLPHKARPPQQ